MLQEILVHAVLKSGDSKTGPIPVTYQTEAATCPDSCPLKQGPCYARFYNVGRVWRNLNNAVFETAKYLTWPRFLDWVKALSPGQFWRYGVAGDLPHTGDGKTIDADKLAGLVEANAVGDKRGMLYTHHLPGVPGNTEAIEAANAGKLVVNVSANGLVDADELADLGIAPVVTIMPETERGTCRTPAGRRVVECLATNPRVPVKNCVECKFMCWRKDRDFIIGFPPHGSAKKSATAIMNVS